MDLQGVLKRVSWRVQVVVGLSAGALVFSHVFSSKRRKREFKDQSWLGLKTRSRDATLSRHKGININELYLHTKLPSTSPTGEVWRGKWQGNEIAAKVRMHDSLTTEINCSVRQLYKNLQ